MAPRKPIPGLYDAALTTELERALADLQPELKEIANLDREEAPRVLARLVQQRLVHALNSFPKDQSTAPQLALTNELLKRVAELAPEGGAEERLAEPARKLLAVRTPAVSALGKPVSPQRPVIPLSTSDLIVNGHHDISLAPEVKRELASADGVDLLCSFLKWSGLRLVLDELKELLSRKPNSVRVLTTAYMSATERRALDELQAIGAQLRVSYDTEKTRLHAKAWLFHRETGFSTGYIGSSNLSAAAMLDGLEWNVRLSTQDNRPILEKFRTTFEQYWADTDFRPYVPKEFDEAVKQQRDDAARPFFVVDVAAKPHQQEILDDLAAERDRGHHRNLVVAATGTGKTIVAALDYRRLREKHPKLLFVAHRKEILEQSLYAFRAVLREGSFGELLVGEHQPVQGQHVFASIQSLHRDRVQKLSPDAFDVVIVDEFHHAAADSYEEVLEHLTPKILLGLTATPERADGKSVLHHFDGRIASELRLWKALDQGLLSPFHYFGVGGPDLTGVRWANGRYVTDELSNVYTANDAFALRVRQELQRRVRDVHSMKALGFCVDIAHAEHMARKFSESGLAARAVSSATSPRERDAALAALKGGSIQVLFSVDLFNEGVDLPDVDTVMFLRPTESATVFLQQLGRGLRKSQKKECLTVLDFIGAANRKFRFDQRFRAVVGGTRRDILREVQQGFPSLPSGCVIELNRQSQEAVLDNIKAAIGLGRRELINDLKQLGPATNLVSFLERTELEPEDLYGADWSFSHLRRAAGFDSHEPDERERQIERAFSRRLHIDDQKRLDGFHAFLSQPSAPRGDANDLIQRWLWVALGYQRDPLTGLTEAWKHLWRVPSLKAELSDLLVVLAERSRWLWRPVLGRLAQLPLQLHARYSKVEAMAALNETDSKQVVAAPREGKHFSQRHQVELLFVTLDKSDGNYTPTTLYDDYPISPSRFHWQSQSTTHEDHPTGKRYRAASLDAPEQLMLLVRERQKDERGETMPYVNLGPVIYRSHTGNRPMSIEWELAHEMPMWLFQETKRAAG